MASLPDDTRDTTLRVKRASHWHHLDSLAAPVLMGLRPLATNFTR